LPTKATNLSEVSNRENLKVLGGTEGLGNVQQKPPEAGGGRGGGAEKKKLSNDSRVLLGLFNSGSTPCENHHFSRLPSPFSGHRFSRKQTSTPKVLLGVYTSGAKAEQLKYPQKKRRVRPNTPRTGKANPWILGGKGACIE